MQDQNFLSLLKVFNLISLDRLFPGQAGSCVPVFSTMPFFVCGVRGCRYASRNDKSYWLSTKDKAPKRPFDGTSIRNHISRCVVCEAPTSAVALHDPNSKEPPECPENWRGLWSGNSFLMVSTNTLTLPIGDNHKQSSDGRRS